MSDDNNKPVKTPTNSDKAKDEAQIKSSQSEQKASCEKPEKLFNAKPAPKMSTQRHKKSRFWLWFASLLILLLLAALAWTGYRQYQIQQQLQAWKAVAEQRLTAQNEQIKTALQSANSNQQLVLSSQQQVIKQTQLINQLEQSLTATQQIVRELSGRKQQDWLLAEAEYLIKLAQLKITLEKDPVTAIALLKTADQRVLETADNSLLELRQVIARDISQLQSTRLPDINGLTSQLHSIINQIPQLELLALELQPVESKPQVDSSNANPFDWKQIYEGFLDDFVTIKEHSEAIKPLMTPNQRGNLNANIQLALQQAQIALLRGDDNLYQINLNNAAEWISEFFQFNLPAQTILQKLAALKQQPIKVQLPEKLTSSSAIYALNQQRLYQWLQQNQQPESPEPSEQAEQNVENPLPAPDDAANQQPTEPQS